MPGSSHKCALLMGDELMLDAAEKKKYRERANRARRGLLNEKKKYGDISDGSGKRFRVGVFYLRSGDVAKALEFYAWYEQEFPDDVGEPFSDLYWALAHYRAGNLEEARVRLQHTMLQNLYLLPFVFGEPMARLEIWHSSNCQEPEYVDVEPELLDEPTDEERGWIRREFYSKPFEELRATYIKAYAALLGERDIDKRGGILNEWYRVCRTFFPNEPT